MESRSATPSAAQDRGWSVGFSWIAPPPQDWQRQRETETKLDGASGASFQECTIVLQLLRVRDHHASRTKLPLRFLVSLCLCGKYEFILFTTITPASML